MFLRYEPVAPYASLGLAISVLLIKPGLLPLPFTWAEVFPAMDSAARFAFSVAGALMLLNLEILFGFRASIFSDSSFDLWTIPV